ncbi:hypothetical protein ACJX0J_037695 [Zea mays]
MDKKLIIDSIMHNFFVSFIDRYMQSLMTVFMYGIALLQEARTQPFTVTIFQNIELMRDGSHDIIDGMMGIKERQKKNVAYSQEAFQQSPIQHSLVFSNLIPCIFNFKRIRKIILKMIIKNMLKNLKTHAVWTKTSIPYLCLVQSWYLIHVSFLIWAWKQPTMDKNILPLLSNILENSRTFQKKAQIRIGVFLKKVKFGWRLRVKNIGEN